MLIALLAQPPGDYHWSVENDQAFWWGALVVGLCLLGAFLFAGRRKKYRG